MITVFLSDQDAKHIELVRARMRYEAIRDSDLQGHQVQVERGEHTCVDTTGDECVGARLLGLVYDLLDRADRGELVPAPLLEALNEDLAALPAEKGLQRALLDSLVDESRLDRWRDVAGKCKGATETRAILDGIGLAGRDDKAEDKKHYRSLTRASMREFGKFLKELHSGDWRMAKAQHDFALEPVFTKDDYLSRFDSFFDAVQFEQRCLSIGREFLPDSVRDVLDGHPARPAYWTWLCAQFDGH